MPIKSGKRKKDKCKVGDVKIMMCVSDFSGRKIKKPKWVRLPGMKDLEYDLIEKWYWKMMKQRAIKLVFIHGMQTCVRLTYLDKIPSWFNQKITSNTPEKTVNDYFAKAKRILNCMKRAPREEAGYLLTQATYGSEKRSQFKFKNYTTLANECKYYDDEYKSVYQIIGAINYTNAQPHTILNKEGGWMQDDELLCTDVKRVMVELMELVLKNREVDVLLYSGLSKLKDIVEAHRHFEDLRKSKMEEKLKPNPENVDVEPDLPPRPPTLPPHPSSGTEGLRASMKGDEGTQFNPNPRKQSQLEKLGHKDSFNPSFGRSMTGRGWSAGTTPMVGFVRPYRISAMESYTGMTPRMYGNHINARTGVPTGMGGNGLARANSYYGSYRLGEKLNPMNSFGRRRRGPDDDDDELRKRRRRTTKRRTAKKSSVVKKMKTTKKRKTTKRVTRFGNQFFF